ncbi:MULTISPECIES: mechanosensitive ion channel family protein [Vibrio]|uniref:Small-conductance mechanosensitive channel n=1 Tax=Vibrio cyclitrophicus ZF270 TaxID=1136176 RepID=A0AAN0NBN2_9VIBR|nr:MULTISPECIES: mechanosensitive ion channel domain-containing protein [Vibrio]MBY7660275.1 mechanosensitive ion channel [Vibrio atlanticus]ERM60802.1 Potassium efflux system KefA protein / Small-conductance mechanosensitive channel [Vibrio cyclitrophicus FF75]KAA8597374.1 Potassium efflux system KefA protein [Vibrio cyclitrophicus]MBU2933370.1 mechanosensitive ion channel family protein [Vibrio cyclitrophicus]MCC4775477.1 mechanosensitive ion channel family protein [Vibrio cyclitrophicus]|tara:strand:+ start:2775 stop:3662 length:888 start_codon:yes stop_codon:yes gene_type:complete
MKKLFVLLLVGLATTVSFPTYATEELANVENISKIASLVRWSGVFFSMIVIAAMWLLLKFINSLVTSFGSQFVQYRMLLQKLQSFTQFFIYVSTGLIVFMMSFRINDQILALIGGTLAVSVGFALKDLAASFIAGITVMIDRPFQVGDRVTFEGNYGDIITIGLRSVRMRTLNDDIITIPNNKFLNEVTTSGNYGALDMQVVIPFYVGMNEDITLARDLIQEAASSSRYIHLPKPVTVLVKQTITDNYLAIQLTCKAYVVDTAYEKLFETDITLRVMKEFRKHNINPPKISVAAH